MLRRKPLTEQGGLRRRDTFQLVVWREQVTSANNVTVNLAVAPATVKIYDTTVGDTPLQTQINTTSVPLTISDHAMVVEIH
jgi:hypothetical protein